MRRPFTCIPCSFFLVPLFLFLISQSLAGQNSVQPLTPPRSAPLKQTSNFEVTRFGAVADGAIGSPNTGHNNAVAINAAIKAACAVGGGTVSIPAGVFNIAMQPDAPRPDSGVAAITIPCSNITLQGAGHDSTTLSFWLISQGRDVVPTSICPRNPDVVSAATPRAWRGSGIYISGGTDPQKPRVNVIIKDLRITGNAEIDGDNRNPVLWDGTTPLPHGSRCNGWDTSNKGIYLQNNDFSRGPKGVEASGFYPAMAAYYDGIQIINVHVDHFLGELLYGGNLGLIRSSVQSSEFDHTNGDCISVGGGWRFDGNYCHDSAANAFENTPGSRAQSYTNNRIQDVALDGIGITNFAYRTHANFEYGEIQIQNNILTRVKRNGISLYNASHATITGNKIVDSHSAILLYDFGEAAAAPSDGGMHPGVPALRAEAAGANSRVPPGKLFVSVAWHFGDPPSAGVKYASPPSDDQTIAMDGRTQLQINPPALPSANGADKPTGWLVFIGRTHESEHQQGSIIPIGSDFVLSQEPAMQGVLRSSYGALARAPESAPVVRAQSGGALGPGSYDVATAWVTAASGTWIISPPSPKSPISLPVANQRLVVTEPSSPPENTLGYLVFIGPSGGALHLAGAADAAIRPSESASITAPPPNGSHVLPGPSGAILSPNVSDVEIRNNVILADGANVSAGIECCGVPKVWPMVQHVSIGGNTIGETKSGKSANLHVAKPTNLPLELSNSPQLGNGSARIHAAPAGREVTLAPNSSQ